MNRILIYIISSLALICTQGAHATPEKTIHIVSQGWENYAAENCQGYMWDVVEAVYSSEGYKLKCTIVPYKRGVEMVKRDMADAWVASYKDEQKFAIYPSWPHDFERTGVIATKDTMKRWLSNDSLNGKKVAFVRGYELDSYIDNDFQKIEVNDLKQAMDMVLAGRSDYASDDADDMNEFLNQNPQYNNKLEVRELFKLALYLAFNDSTRSRKLINIWDKGLPSLIENGALREIYEKAGKAEDYQSYWQDYSKP